MDYFFIGEQELVTAFRFVGVEGVAVGDQGSSRSAFLRITQGWDETAGTYLPASDPVQVLILTEEVADWLDKDLTEWQLSGKYPLIVEIPGLEGRLAGRKTLVDSIREAVGIRV